MASFSYKKGVIQNEFALKCFLKYILEYILEPLQFKIIGILWQVSKRSQIHFLYLLIAHEMWHSVKSWNVSELCQVTHTCCWLSLVIPLGHSPHHQPQPAVLGTIRALCWKCIYNHNQVAGRCHNLYNNWLW